MLGDLAVSFLTMIMEVIVELEEKLDGLETEENEVSYEVDSAGAYVKWSHGNGEATCAPFFRLGSSAPALEFRSFLTLH